MTLIAMTCLMNANALAGVSIDYSAAELVLRYFRDGPGVDEREIVRHPAYQHIILHSKKYSSQPLSEADLEESLRTGSGGFDFSGIRGRTDTLQQTIGWLKDNSKNIETLFCRLPLPYLPQDYRQNAVIYIVIGGYNGVAFDGKVCVNIDHRQFRARREEILFYIAHELFHIGFEKYHALPDVFAARTIGDLRDIVLLQTMNEGLATLVPYHKRLEMDETRDEDYAALLDEKILSKKMTQFAGVMGFMEENAGDKLTGETLADVLGQCSGDRLFYVAGCHMGLTIEKKLGRKKIRQLIKDGPEVYYRTYKRLMGSDR
jgi:hypothetical protein